MSTRTCLASLAACRQITAFALATALLAGCTPGRDAAVDEAAVKQALAAQFDRPEAPLRVEPVVVEGDAAVAGWTQGERGGRALLRRHDTAWRIALCAGDGLQQATLLQEAGVAARDAAELVRRLGAAEAALPAAHRARFSTFDGVVRMDATGAHPPVDPAAHGAAHAHPAISPSSTPAH